MEAAQLDSISFVANYDGIFVIFPNQRLFIARRNSFVKEYPDADPSTESMLQCGHITVPSASHSVISDEENVLWQEKHPQMELFRISSRFLELR